MKAVLDLMENHWINPLTHDQTELVSFSTGIVAPPEVARDLLTAHMVKEEVNQNFKKDRLESEPRTVKFHEKMKKQNLKTFSDIKTKHTGNKAHDVIIKAQESIWGHDHCSSEQTAADQRCSCTPVGTTTLGTRKRR